MKPQTLPARTLDEVVAAFPSYRQSLLSSVDNCALSTRFELEGSNFNNAAQARGIIFHRFAAELLKTLWRTGEHTVPTEEAIQILYEVSRQRDVPDKDVVIVPVRERRYLRMCALRMAAKPFDCVGMLDVEEQLETVLKYPIAPVPGIDLPNFAYRTVTGRPDALIADAPDGIIVLDHKTAPSAPAQGDQPHWSGDHLHVSYEGYFQQRMYALLVMHNFPTVQRVILKEYYVVPDEAREATVPREALEHIEQEMAVLCEFLDRALEGGSGSELWRPSPGVHCGYCRRPTSCPIEAEARAMEGGITSDAQAARVAAEVAVADTIRGDARTKGGIAALKAYHDKTGRPIPVKDAKGRHAWRWGEDSKGNRRFKLHVPEKSDRGPRDPALEQAFNEAAERKAAA